MQFAKSLQQQLKIGFNGMKNQIQIYTMKYGGYVKAY
jgi:hypothetical protein